MAQTCTPRVNQKGDVLEKGPWAKGQVLPEDTASQTPTSQGRAVIS